MRFHTSNGQFVGWSKLPGGGMAFGQAVIRKIFGRIPRQPWIPFAARKALQEIIHRESVIWEVGAGYSTLWLADRAKNVTSIEASKEWHDRLAGIIAVEHIENIDLRYEWEAQRMADFSELKDGSIDLLFIDGGPRGQCLANGFQKVKSGGYVYLDNWDSKHFWGDQVDFPSANKAMIAEKTSFVDYVPAQFGVYEGLLLKRN